MGIVYVIGCFDNATGLAQPGAAMMNDTNEGDGDDNEKVDNDRESCAIQELCRQGLDE